MYSGSIPLDGKIFIHKKEVKAMATTFEHIYNNIEIAPINTIIDWLNGDGKSAIKEQVDKVVKALNERIKEENGKARDARIESLLAMDSKAFWYSYAINPHFEGKKITETPEGEYKVVDADMPLKFKVLEGAYQDSKNSKTVTLCAFKQWDIAVALFNYHLQAEKISGGSNVVTVKNAVNKDKVLKAMEAMPDCFKSNTKQNRILMLKHICNLMCGEEMGVKPMSFDVKYLQEVVSKAKHGNISTLSDWALTDEIIVTIGMCLNVDENGKRKVLYTVNNKGGFAVKSK